MAKSDTGYDAFDSRFSTMAPATVTIRTAEPARVRSRIPATRQLPRYMPDHQKTSTVTGAKVVARSSTAGCTTDQAHASPFRPTVRYATALARKISTKTTNIPRLTTGT